MYKRIATLLLSSSETCFLWGPRQSGKSTLLAALFPHATRYDLLKADEVRRLIARPEAIREECEERGLTGENQQAPIIIDEIQRIPELLDEVHWLIENRKLRFILCGSSARKLKRSHANLLGGRAIRYELFPLVYPEINDFSLDKALNSGLIPRHYLSADPMRLLQSYVSDYLQQEILAEALVRRIAPFHRFLEIAAISNGKMLNFTTIASECGVSAPTVQEYFTILHDTLLGAMVPAFRKRAKRRVVGAPKFYFCDLGIVGALTHRGSVQTGSELFGRVFEHFVLQELRAHSSYSGRFYPICYWRTTSGYEVDFILGGSDVAIEVKSSQAVRDDHLKGLRAFKEEHPSHKAYVVSQDPQPRLTHDGITILPWKVFIERLWGGEIVT